MIKILLVATAVSIITIPCTALSAGQRAEVIRQKAEPLTELAPSTIPVEHSIVMGNPSGSKKLYIFTDPDCPGCRKQHGELKKLVQDRPDLTIHLLFFPSSSHRFAYEKSRIALASRNAALLDPVFAGELIPRTENPADGKAALDATIRFAGQSRIVKTPTVILPDGRVVVGVLPARKLAELIGE